MAERGSIPAVVLGGNGYVAGEVLRLLAGHPVLRVAVVASSGHVGEKVTAAFPHLVAKYPAESQ